MIKVIYPDIKPRIRSQNNMEEVFCAVRKRWLRLTPEEWVRQNFILYLTQKLNFPLSLISVEKKLVIGEMVKRYDIVVFNRNMKTHIVVECKEIKVKIGQSTLHQILQYNTGLQAQILVVTNGNVTYGFQKGVSGFSEIDKISCWQQD